MNYLISKHSSKQVYNYHPRTMDELQNLVDKLIEKRGNKAYLNDIYTSDITVMSCIFYCS